MMRVKIAVASFVFMALVGGFFYKSSRQPVKNISRPDYDFRWDMPDGVEVTDIETADSGMIVKIKKSKNPGPRRAYRIVLIQGGEDTK